MSGAEQPHNSFSLSAVVESLAAGLSTVRADEQRFTALDSAQADLEDGGDQSSARRQSSALFNRARVSEHERVVAHESLLYNPLILWTAVTGVILIFVASLCIHIYGWLILFREHAKPCDKPLALWLGITLFCPIVRQTFNVVSLATGNARYSKFSVLLTPAAIVAGLWLFWHTRTCRETSPTLYAFVKMYLMLQVGTYVCLCVSAFLFVATILWVQRQGLLGPGPHMAARSGLIDDVKTVSYEEAIQDGLLAQAANSGADGSAAEPPECSICSEEFKPNSERPIKKTPCGHFFCKECLGTWLEKYNKNCPLCRLDLQAAVDGNAVSGEP